jgi:hypothetical protein
MEKGQRVLIKGYPHKELERVVLEEANTYILVCRPEVYESIKDDRGLSGYAMGFPKKDVIKMLPPS